MSGSLDEARLKVASIRAGEAADEARSAGRADRVWMEERGGFLTQILIDPAFYATYSSELLDAEANGCLAELIDTSSATRAGSSREGPRGGRR